MSIQKRKVGFYSLRLKDIKNEDNHLDPTCLHAVINYIDSLPKLDRFYDISSSNKFHVLTSVFPIDTNLGIQNLIFASAKYNHRPPLINKDTAQERESPKELMEGELENTHLALKFLQDEIILITEERKAGISINTVISYLMHYSVNYCNKNNNKLDFKIEWTIIPKGDFLHELKKLERVRFGHIFTDKQLLGSEYLNFSGSTDQIEDELYITIKAKKKRSIKSVIEDFFRRFSTNNSLIKKIRVYGYTKEGNQIMLDTDIIKRVEYVNAELNKITGIVDSDNLFKMFVEILAGYNN